MSNSSRRTWLFARVDFITALDFTSNCTFALLFYTLYICPHFLNPNYRSTPILRREANGGGMGEKTYTLGMDDPLCIHRELTEHSALDFSKAPHDISNQITTNTTHQFYRCKSAPLPFHRLKCRFDMWMQDGGRRQRAQIWGLEELGRVPGRCSTADGLLLYCDSIQRLCAKGLLQFMVWRAFFSGGDGRRRGDRFLGAREGSRDFCVISCLFRVLSEVRLNQLSLYPLHSFLYSYMYLYVFLT